MDAYEHYWTELEQTSTAVLDYNGRSLFNTWNISYNLLQGSSLDASRLLEILGYFNNQDIWFELLRGATDPTPQWYQNVISSRVRFNPLMKKLQDFNFVSCNHDQASYTMHSCILDWIRHRLNHPHDPEMCGLALDCMSNSASDVDRPRFWEADARMEGHAFSIARCLDELEDDELKNQLDDPKSGKSIAQISDILRRRGHFKAAERLFLKVFQSYQRAIDSSQILSTVSLYDSASELYRQGKYDQIVGLVLHTLIECEASPTSIQMITLKIAQDLTNDHHGQKDFVEAMKMPLHVLKWLKKMYGDEHRLTLDTLVSVGNMYANRQYFFEAEQLYSQALTGYEKSVGYKYIGTLDVLHSLGTMYLRQNRVLKAEKLLMEALKGKDELLG